MLVKQLECVGRNAEHEIAMERGDHLESTCLGYADRLLARRLIVGAKLDQLSAESSHRGILFGRVAQRNIDAHENIGARRGEGETLAVVAARRRYQTATSAAPLHLVDIGEARRAP